MILSNHLFPISSSDCELLLLLEITGSVPKVAEYLRRDISVVSRQIAKLSKVAPLVEKENGKWKISDLGREFTRWTRDSIHLQNNILQNKILIKIVTTHEFATRVLVPQLENIQQNSSHLMFEIMTSAFSVEKFLLENR